MNKKIHSAAAVIVMSAAAAFAAVPDFINFQGRLLDPDRLPRNGSFAMTFKICDSLAASCAGICQTGNACLWSETKDIPVTNGVFSVQLGSTTALTPAAFSAAARYLEITVGAETLAPREQLAAGAYSLKAALADGISGNDGSALLGVSSIALAGFFSDNAVRSNLGLAIGTNVQAYSANLTTLAGLDGSTLTGVKTSSVALAGFFSDNAVRSNLGLAIGTNVQAYSANLTTLAGLDGSTLLKISSIAVDGVYTGAIRDLAVTDAKLAGSITPSKVTGTAAVLGANTFTGAQTYNTGSSIAAAATLPGVTISTAIFVGSGANISTITPTGIYGTYYGDGSNLVRISSVALSGFFSDNAVRSNLGLAIGTNVQAYSANLTTLAGLDGSTLTGVKTSSVALSGFFSDNAVRSNLGLAIGTNVQAYSANLTTLAGLNGSTLTGVAVLAATQTLTGVNIFTSTTAFTEQNGSYPGVTVSSGFVVLSGSISINSAGQGNISIGGSAFAGNIDIGVAAGVVKVIDIGGTGANVINVGNAQTGGSVSLGAAMTTGGINIGGTNAQTGSINIGAGTGAQIMTFGGGSGAKTISIGTGSTSSKIKLGSAGSYFVAMGTCTIASTAMNTTRTATYACSGVPASTDVAVTCSGASTMSANGVVLYCRATGTVNQVGCHTSVANSTAQTWKCMWLR